MLCHRHAMPSKSSYSANPASQRFLNTPARSHSKNRLCTALALPNRSFGNAFHWHPVRRTYTMASKVSRGDFGFRPAPGPRTYSFALDRSRTGIKGSTRLQNSSVTTHDSTRLFFSTGTVGPSPQRRCGSDWHYI